MKFKNGELGYIGRPAMHSYATGAPNDHKYEDTKLWKDFEYKIFK